MHAVAARLRAEQKPEPHARLRVEVTAERNGGVTCGQIPKLAGPKQPIPLARRGPSRRYPFSKHLQAGRAAPIAPLT